MNLVAQPLLAHHGRNAIDSDNLVVANTLRSNERNTSQGPGNYVLGCNASGGGSKDLAIVEDETPPVTGSNGDAGAVAYPLARRGREGGAALEIGGEGTYNALRAGDGGSSRLNQVLTKNAVRRLTPVECERLQGFPDDWTALGPDSRRYAALGDAVTVPVAEWIGRRIIEKS